MRSAGKPLVIDLFCGLGGWAEGFLAEGYNVVGFDIERHDYGSGGYPGQLVLQDVLTLHGSQFRDAAVIVASPPCQFFSYCAMPWTRAKELATQVRASQIEYAKRCELFFSCFRIAREAGVPLIVENVRGAQPWVGYARYYYGSFYLWGDLPALMPRSQAAAKRPGMNWSDRSNPDRMFNDGRKVPSFRFDGSGGSFQTAGVKAYGGGFGWDESPLRSGNSKSSARKAASAQIAKIPFPLAQHIAKCFHP